MARYENEPRPQPVWSAPKETLPEESGGDTESIPHPEPYSSTVLPYKGYNPYSRQNIGNVIIEKERFHHNGHGTIPKGVERGKSRTSNRGIGAVRRPTAPRGLLTLVLFEPEALMTGRDAGGPLSYGRFAMREEFRENGTIWCEDEPTGVIAAMNLDLEKVTQMCISHGMRSALFIEVNAEWTQFHSLYVTFRNGKMRRGRERRVLDINPSELFDSISACLMTRIPDLTPLAIETD